jgi:hypothetical protein
MSSPHGLLDDPELHLFLKGFQDSLPVDLVHIGLRFVVNRGFQKKLNCGIFKEPLQRKLEVLVWQRFTL